MKKRSIDKAIPKCEGENTLSDWFDAIKHFGELWHQQKAKERKEKARIMRVHLSHQPNTSTPIAALLDQNANPIVWVDNTPYPTWKFPKKILTQDTPANEKILAYIFDECQNRLTWHERFAELCERLK